MSSWDLGFMRLSAPATIPLAGMETVLTSYLVLFFHFGEPWMVVHHLTRWWFCKFLSCHRDIFDQQVLWDQPQKDLPHTGSMEPWTLDCSLLDWYDVIDILFRPWVPSLHSVIKVSEKNACAPRCPFKIGIFQLEIHSLYILCSS